MNLKFRSLTLLPVTYILLACGKLFPTIAQPPPLPTDISHLLRKPASASSSSTSPVPTFILIIATLSPSFIIITIISSTRRPTSIPLDMLLRIFKHLWSIVDNINDSSTVPLVVHGGSGTVSFGEIYTAVHKHISLAQRIATTTEGNVESLWGNNFEDGSAIWLENETFNPNNHPEQDWEQTGIVPDISVSGDFNEYLKKDSAILAVIRYLSKK